MTSFGFCPGSWRWKQGWYTMADFPQGNFADYALLEDCPYVDDCIFAPEFMSSDYVRVTQLYCDGAGRQYKDYAQTEGNLEFDICTMWCSKPVSVLQDYCDAIKVHIFWPLLFQREQSSIITRMHSCVRTSGSHACEISLKKLQQLELMEDIVDLAKKVVNDTFFIGGLLRIGYKIENKILAMEEALNWVKYTGDVTILSKLGAVDNCWRMLSIFFTEYKYHITKVVTENCSLLEEFKTQSCAECLEQGELMKMKGNEEFSKERYDIAIIYYTRAIECRPENHLLYGNRALCFLRTGQFRNALGDGKRATILKNNWTKGHYRYCAALSMLGEYDWALQANIKAQKLCKNDPEGIKDLIQQHIKLQKQIEDLQGQTPASNPVKAFCESRAYIPSLSAPAFSTSLNFVETEKNFRKTNHEMANGSNQNPKVVDEALKVDDCDCHPEFVPPSSQPPKYKGKQKSRNNELEKFSPGSQETLPVDLKNILEKQFSKSSRAAHQDFANIMKMLRSLIQDGYTALLEQRCRSAAQAFTELLNGLDPQKIKQLNLAMINYVLVVYGLAISLLGIGQPEELSEAENQFKRMIEHYPNEGLDCLAYCGIGKVYLKKNRFLEALNHFEKARTLICRLPGVLTWPTSNVVIEETQPGKIKMLLEKFVEECRFPPVPDATCCYQKCHGYSKIQIYITDPDFKGFIRISCCQYCKIEFHMNCWKKLKTTTFNDKIDKDFLQGICLTPDCEGIISKIIIFSSGGQVKCEFEHKVIKEKVPPRPILKQKCSSLEKLRLKEDKKLKRKLQKKEAKKLAQERLEEDLRESNPPKTEEQRETINHVQSCQFLDDRILQCIKQYADKIKSGILNTSKLLKELLSWKVLTTEDYTTCFSSRNFLNEAVDYVIRHLIQEKNRVKTRVFLHVLSELKEVDPKLATWIQKLNSFGLDATGPFFSRYGAPLKELDFSIMTFLWNEKYGHKLGSIEGKQLDYFYEPTSLKEARCLIWLLEEHRDKFPALHNALDEFFDIMDSRCTVLRKQDSGDVPFNSTKIKNKGKKKKPKDSKVSWNITHQEVNTEPYGPFEAQQGGISQVEKEYQVLQEQLKEACENYEYSNVKGSEETKDLEEKLKRNVEENKISKTELDWFLEDLNKEIKKWEQEKKEIQDRLKALKKKVKKVLNASKMYTQENDGKEKALELLLDQSLEISNTFTNEKMKIEESIKKGKEHYEDSLQRAVDAEVSVLENWKDMEVCKLQTMESQAERFLKHLRLMSSDSAAYSDMDSDIHSWESFLSDVREEIEKAKSQFEEQIQAIKNGSQLSELPKVQISELSFPTCNTIHPKLLPESSGQDGQGPSTSTSHGTGDQTAAPEESSLGSAADSPVESPSCSQKAPQLPEHEGAGQAAGPEPGPVADQKLPAAPERATHSSQSPKKPFNSIIEHLSVVFPCYSSTELAGFIKKVRNKNKTSLSGLSIDEIAQRVTEHILDEERKKKPNPGKDRRPSAPSSAVAAPRAAQDPPSMPVGASPETRGPRTEDIPVSCANSCEMCREVFKSKHVRELQCGHRLHKGCFKQWLKSQRTCPACLGHDLLSEE
ncbi:E3 ubiquitin-protein ligase TTC3 isoform X5 [Bubalus kerabau]|uniref:E3 ubiquitin-protein ligase TTC3 isoform X5 n=1 Tax=Bubalus carabanensis TaxID=3119969 RepID=UPI00244EB91A|nr:E3 ubiquitin-protein ligase TTC3 isoform X5 [Bubalus carabanensis]